MNIKRSMIGIYESARGRARPACWAVAAIATMMACAAPADLSNQNQTALLPPAALACGAFPGPLTGSTFEGANGDFVAACAGDEDWATSNPTFGKIATANDKPSGPTDDSFGQGTKEDNLNVVVVNGSIPPNKNDLTRFYVASETTSTADGPQNFLYLAWERAAESGSVNLDFELNQHVTENFPSSGGPVTLNRTAGDILITYDFGGSGAPALGLLKWLPAETGYSASDCFKNNALPCWGNRVDLSAAGYAQGAVNTGTVTDSVESPSISVAKNLFGEAAINLTAAGVFPAGTCKAFGSAFLKSRSSFAFGAEIKDFIGPAPISVSNCGTIKISKVTNEGQTAEFNYTTTGGLSPSTFTLQGGDSTTYSSVLSGSYSVTELTPLPAGWTFSSLKCTSTGTGTSASISSTTANIVIAGDGEVDCTYTNHKNLSPTIATTLSKTSASIGDTVHDSATLTNASAKAGGTVKYTAYTDSACSVGAMDAGTKTVTDGVVPDSDGITFNSAGTFYWQAVYSGDVDNNPATSNCTDEKLVVSKNSPTIATTLSVTTGQPIGTTIHDSATLTTATSNAGGTVTYTVFTDNACSQGAVSAGTKTVTNGVVPDSDPITFNTAGTFYWQAVYSGDANNNGATSNCTDEVVTINPNTTTTVTAQKVLPNDSATLGGLTSNASGTITFKLYDPTAPNCIETAPVYTDQFTVSGNVNTTFNTINTDPPTPPHTTTYYATGTGTWKWQVIYSGDTNNLGSTSACGVEQFTIVQ